MSEVGRLNGKVAIVTGAAGGIGEAICERFLAEGANVMMVGRNLENLQSVYDKLSVTYKENVAMVQCDVTEEKSASESFSMTLSQFGQNCNVLVNCAGVAPLSPIVQTSLASFNEVLSTNLFGVFTFTKEFLRRLELGKNKDATGASIVNVSSLAGQVGVEDHASYAASKAGLNAFTKTTCIEVGKFGVRCNAVTPGVIDTLIQNNFDPVKLEAVRPLIPMGRFGKQVEVAKFETLKAMIPMRRLGKPIEVANACLFLASDESSYVNGATLQISGGLFA